MKPQNFDLLTILGPTATGKTSLAVAVAALLDAELLSADSRQVYRGMDIGTGKDLNEYHLPDNKDIPYYLIDIREPGESFSLYDYIGEFRVAYSKVLERDRFPILVGGTGLYIETVLGGKRLHQVPPNENLRIELQELGRNDLFDLLHRFRFRPRADLSSNRRLIRAIEIAQYYDRYPEHKPADAPLQLKSVNIGLMLDRDTRVARIEERLHQRLEEGMIEEVKGLLDRKIPEQVLLDYGLEYRYITSYLLGHLSRDEMIQQLSIAIRQFSKRQMTWFRGMERRGFHIHWIDGLLPLEEKVYQIQQLVRQEG